jgi:hydrogenase maturation protease
MRGHATARAERTTPPLVIGVGNDRRGDDRSGLDVARALAPRLQGRAQVVECASDLTELLELWSGREDVIVVDGVRSGRPAGTVVRLEVGPQGLPAFGPTSTHGLSLSEAVGLGRTLGRFPRRLVIYGIEVGDVALHEGLTAAVAQAVAETTARIADELVDELASGPGV